MKTMDSGLGRPPEAESSDSTPQAGVFALTGEYWTVGCGGVVCSLRHTLGLSYLQRLLQNPGEELHALDLLMGPEAVGPEPGSREEAILRQAEDVVARRSSDLGPMLDTRAKQEFRSRLLELGEELEDLREKGAYERAEEVAAEIESIQRELVRALGLGGRDRRAGSEAEKARINVTRAIRAAIQRISDHHEALGKLLEESIRTGSFCRYLPNPRAPIVWRFTSEAGAPSVVVATPVAAAPPAPRFVEPDLGLAQPPNQTAFVGRSAEYAALREGLNRAIAAQGGIVAISGEPGIGKTRLAREVGAEARHLGFVALAGSCYDREDSVPFVPVVEILEVALAQNPTPQNFRETLGDDAADIARLMPQLRRLFPDIPAPPPAAPEQARRALFMAIERLIIRQSRIHPMLLLFEDVHWADEGTLALIAHFARAVAHLRVIMILTYRDEAIDPGSPFGQALDDLIRSRVVQVPLQGLSEAGVAEMIAALSGREPSAALANLFYANTEGNPLFVEELFRNLERNGQLGEALERLGPGELDLPHSLRLIIARRLVRVSKATQRMLSVAAVIGRSFTFALLEGATRIEADELVELVEEAEKAGLISSKLRYPDAQFKFAHELIRRAVLDDLSVARRQRLHLSVGEAIELLNPNTLDEQAEDLAHHYWNAGAAAPAARTIRYLQVAGTKAVQAAANVEAIGHFRKALQLVNSAPDSPERTQSELMLQMALSVPLSTTKGYASPELEAVFARARHLCKQAGEAPQLFPVLWGMWLFHTGRAEHLTARDLAGQCLRLAEKTSDPKLLVAAHHALGVSLSSLADFGPALDHKEQALRLYDPEQHASLALQFGHDFGVVSRSQAALDLWYLGYPERALAMSEEALCLARKVSQPLSLVVALLFATRVHVLARDVAAAEKHAEEALKLADEGDFSFWRPVASIYHGWALAQGPGIEGGIAEICEGLDAIRASGAGSGRPSFLASLAEAYGRGGRVAEALDALSEAYATVKQSAERWSESELYRIEGEVTLKLSGSQRLQATQRKRAEDCFLRAIEIAHDQKAKLLELRATVSLYRLWTSQGKRAEARRRVEEVYRWFTEGFASPDLTEAASLLKT